MKTLLKIIVTTNENQSKLFILNKKGNKNPSIKPKNLKQTKLYSTPKTKNKRIGVLKQILFMSQIKNNN